MLWRLPPFFSKLLSIRQNNERATGLRNLRLVFLLAEGGTWFGKWFFHLMAAQLFQMVSPFTFFFLKPFLLMRLGFLGGGIISLIRFFIPALSFLFSPKFLLDQF